MGNFESTLARMKELYNYGKLNESANPSVNENSSIECHRTAANGKEYGIIREASKYYIKVAPKNKATLAEAYDYIGGITEKKRYQYSSYGDALKNFELKLGAINEGYNGTVNTETLNPYKKNEVIAEGTEKMKNEIARMRQIMHNAAIVLNESAPFNIVDGNPEAPKDKKSNPDFPFTEIPTEEVKEEPKKATEPEKQGNPFKEEAKAAKPEAIKESIECEVEEEPVEDEPEVELGTEASEEPVEDEEDMEFGVEDEDEPEDLEDESEDEEPESSEEDEEEGDELESLSKDELIARIKELEAKQDEPVEDEEAEDEAEPEVEDVPVDAEDEFEPEEDEDELFESRIRRICDDVVKNALKETVLHDFGKHPSYRKQPFTTSPVGEDENEHGKDINHKSVHNNEPYGEKIGDSFPFINKVKVDSIVDKVINEALYGKNVKKK